MKSEPAFPETRFGGNTDRRPIDQTPGMTLRDYFAGQALRAVVEADGYEVAEGRKWLAANCYAIADAMLAERSKP